MSQEYDENHPEVIKAKAEAETEVARAKAEARERVLRARAGLHPVAQAIYAFFDSGRDFISDLGCLLIILVVVLAFLAPKVLEALFGG